MRAAPCQEAKENKDQLFWPSFHAVFLSHTPGIAGSCQFAQTKTL